MLSARSANFSCSRRRTPVPARTRGRGIPHLSMLALMTTKLSKSHVNLGGNRVRWSGSTQVASRSQRTVIPSGGRLRVLGMPRPSSSCRDCQDTRTTAVSLSSDSNASSVKGGGYRALVVAIVARGAHEGHAPPPPDDSERCGDAIASATADSTPSSRRSSSREDAPPPPADRHHRQPPVPERRHP